MSEQDFELYLTLLAKTLRLSDKQRRAIASELRDHLEARLDELTAEGFDKHDAIQTALAEFGDASALANDFTSIGKHRTRRHLMQTAFGTIAAAAVVGFAVTFLTPSNYQGRPAQPPAGAQDSAPEADPTRRGGGGAGTATDPGAAGGRGLGGPATAGGRGVGRGGGMAPAAGLGRGSGRELAIQAVVREVPELADLSIHVVDCTAILSPRADGLDLLARTEALASAVEETVSAIRPHGPAEIQVRAFEEFLIITATEDAYTQAQDLLENISGHVQRRDAIQRERDAAQVHEAVNRLQAEIDANLAEQEALRAELTAVLERLDGVETTSREARELGGLRNRLQDQLDVADTRLRLLEQQLDQWRMQGGR